MDGLVERGEVFEGLVGEVMGLKIAPDRLDFVEFRGVFWQPLDGRPVTRAARAARERLLVWIGPLSSTCPTGFASSASWVQRDDDYSRWAMKL